MSSRPYLYYKKVDPYLCSELAPVLEGSGSRHLYPRKCTSVDRVSVMFVARVDRRIFFTKERWRVGGMEGARGGREGWREQGAGGREEAMMCGRKGAGVEGGRVEGGRVNNGMSEEGTERGMDRVREREEEGSEQMKEGAGRGEPLSEGEEQGCSEGRTEQGRQGNFKGGTPEEVKTLVLQMKNSEQVYKLCILMCRNIYCLTGG